MSSICSNKLGCMHWEVYGHNVMPRWVASGLMLFAVMYAGMKIAFYDQFRVIEVVLVPFAFYAFFRYGRELRTCFPALLMYASVGLVVISWALMTFSYPEIARTLPKITDLIDKFPFVLLAFAIASSKKNADLFLLIAAGSTLFFPWTLGNGIADIIAALEGARTGFGRNPIRISATYAVVLIGMIAFFKRLVMSNGFSWWRFSLWSVLFLVFMFLFLSGRSRGPMLAFALVVSGLVIFMAWHYRKAVFQVLAVSKWYLISFIVVFVFILASAVVMYKPVAEEMVDKTVRESAAIAAFLDGRYAEIPDTSVGYRLQFTVAAFKWGSERPLFGWAYRGGEIAIDKERIAHDHDGRHFNQLHNGYLELWLRYGLAGVLLFVFLITWLFLVAVRGLRSGNLDQDYLIFFIAFLGFYFIVNAFDSFIFIRDGIYIFDIVLAAVFSFIVRDLMVSSYRSSGEREVQ